MAVKNTCRATCRANQVDMYKKAQVSANGLTYLTVIPNIVWLSLGTTTKDSRVFATVVNLCALVNGGQHLFFSTSAGW